MINKEEKAIKFIHTVANATNKSLFAGNSGGKDSAVVDQFDSVLKHKIL